MSRANSTNVAGATSNFKLFLRFADPNVRDMEVVYKNLTATQANTVAQRVIHTLNQQGKTVSGSTLTNIGNLTR